ncbi:(2Fe-2S)-binding protein [Actinomadura rayongensis]|uniref:Bacterioferritin-associated ferredoxin n=1 Tax=Actinomadura rayongensis TaxID=1429076 RepID=A0A6I4W5G0_9ACTN|nr:(2Fe-2S)-binding protein [Actinomadura rayongensis]MXQ64701.1 bacterioferritin-associated ferredoxin-like protein [Actinomadura rayongensis]
MYVCVCHAVTEDDVRSHMARGACRTVRDVKAACGMKPGCGSCTRRLACLLGEQRDERPAGSEPVSAAAG